MPRDLKIERAKYPTDWERETGKAPIVVSGKCFNCRERVVELWGGSVHSVIRFFETYRLKCQSCRMIWGDRPASAGSGR